MSNKVFVSQDFLDHAAGLNACGTLNMEKPWKSRARPFVWKGKLWICVGSASRNLRWYEADIRQVVPLCLYQGPARNPRARGVGYYTGGTFQHKGETYAITALELKLEADGTGERGWQQLALFDGREQIYG